MTITNVKTGEKITASRQVIQDLKLTFTCEMNEAIANERWATARRSACWVDACESALQDYPDTKSWVDYVNNRECEITENNKEHEIIDEIESLKNEYEKATITESQLACIWHSKVVLYSEFINQSTINDELDEYRVVFVDKSEMTVYVTKPGTKEEYRAKLKGLSEQKISKAILNSIYKDPYVKNVRITGTGVREITLDDWTKFRVKVVEK